MPTRHYQLFDLTSAEWHQTDQTPRQGALMSNSMGLKVILMYIRKPFYDVFVLILDELHQVMYPPFSARVVKHHHFRLSPQGSS
jgi:hypothetical protein